MKVCISIVFSFSFNIMFVYLYYIWVSSCVFVFSCTVWGACHIGLCLQATLLATQEKFGQVKSSQVMLLKCTWNWVSNPVLPLV